MLRVLDEGIVRVSHTPYFRLKLPRGCSFAKEQTCRKMAKVRVTIQM